MLDSSFVINKESLVLWQFPELPGRVSVVVVLFDRLFLSIDSEAILWDQDPSLVV